MKNALGRTRAFQLFNNQLKVIAKKQNGIAVFARAS
jgi:hypothetical protein